MTAPPLTFPRATFAALSPHPFLLASLDPPPSSSTSDPRPARRTNGRLPLQARDPHINTSSLSHAHGSAVVRVGDTTVVCGVRGEILPIENIPNYRPRDGLLPPVQTGEGGAERGITGSKEGDRRKVDLANRRELQDYDLLVPNIELATGSARQFLPGQPPTVLAQTLSTRIYTLLHSCDVVDIEDLRIWHHPQITSKPEAGGDDVAMAGADEEEDLADSQPRIAAYWTLYIDLLLLSHDGNIHDAAWAATLVALRATSLPRARYDPDREAVICTRRDPLPLRIRGLPIACTASVFLEKPGQEAQMRHGAGKSWVLVDPDAAEEELCEETVTVVVDCGDGQTRIRRLEKNGGLSVDHEVMKQMVQVAEERWKTFRKVMA